MDSTGCERGWLPAGRTLCFFLVASLIGATAMWGIGMGFLHFFGVLLLVVLAVPSALALLLLSIPWLRIPSVWSGPPTRQVAVGLLFLVAAQVPAMFLGVHIQLWQVDRAKRWCETLVPSIEQWRARTGSYPEGLADLGLELDPPRFCTSSLHYRPNAEGFVLDFSDGGWLSGYEFDSRERTWSHYD